MHNVTTLKNKSLSLKNILGVQKVSLTFLSDQENNECICCRAETGIELFLQFLFYDFVLNKPLGERQQRYVNRYSLFAKERQRIEDE